MPPEDNPLSNPPPDATPPAAAPPPATPPPDGGTPPATDPPATPPATDPPDPDGEPGGGDANARIRGLIAENKALKEYGAHWRDIAVVTTRGPAPAAEPTTPAVTQPQPAPKLKDFDSTEAWADAHAAWTNLELDRRTAAAVDTTLRTRDATTQAQQTADTYRSRMDAFEKEQPNARLVIANPVVTRAIAAQPAIAEVVTASERGPALAFHLANNPAELVRISRLSPAQAAAALGRIEAQLPAAKPSGAAPGARGAPSGTPPPAPPKPQGSRAPEPPNPIDGGGTPTVDDMNLPIDDFIQKINRGRRPSRR